MTIPQGRLRRTAPLAALSARTAGEGVVDVLRRRLKGERGASLEFHVRNAERYADVLSRSKGVLMKVGQILSFVDISAAGRQQIRGGLPSRPGLVAVRRRADGPRARGRRHRKRTRAWARGTLRRVLPHTDRGR